MKRAGTSVAVLLILEGISDRSSNPSKRGPYAGQYFGIGLGPSINKSTETISDISSGYARLRDVTLHYVSAGTGDPVVLLHGWPQTWYMWWKIIPVPVENYWVIAPDLRRRRG